MVRITFKGIANGAALSCLIGSAGLAQSFGESSFEDNGGVANPTPSQQQPAPSNSGAAAGGFGESSFEPGGNGGAVAGVEPPQGSGGSGTGVGGDDFPGNTVLPETPQTDVVVTPNPTPNPNPTPTPTPNPNNTPIDPQVTAFETRDFGVPPQNSLRQGQFHAPTPTAVPGGYLVTTGNLVQAMQGGTQMILIDVLGSGYGLPNAYNAPALASPGSFNDRTQQQAVAWLRQITNNNPNMPLVIYCSDPNCWLSYNASLRAIAAGYQQVYWYRGGIRAWQMLGLPMQPSGF